MRRGLAALAVALLVAGTGVIQYASAQGVVDDTRRSMGNLRPDSYTAGRAIQGSNRVPPSGSPIVVVPYPYYGGYPQYYGGYRPYYPGAYGYNPYYGVPYPYYYGGYRLYPQVGLPPSMIYGPLPMRRVFVPVW